MKEIRILGIQVFDRIKEAGRTQSVMTEHADAIRTRMGFHEVTADVCSRVGFILLELKGESPAWDRLESDLAEIGGIMVQRMSFQL
jgi:hypothetical protein